MIGGGINLRPTSSVTPDLVRGPLGGEGGGTSLLPFPRGPVDPGTSPG